MSGHAVSVAPPLWAVFAAVLLLGLATLVAAVDGVLAARSANRPAVAWTTGWQRLLGETTRLWRQRSRHPVNADRLLWGVGSFALVPIALAMVSVVPLGEWTLFDSPLGVVWFNAMDVTVWAVVWLAGWGPNAVYPLIGGYRFLAQALAYELPLMFALVAPAIAAGSLGVGDIVDAQSGLWNVVWMPVAFGVFCLGVLGFSVWGPFSAPVATDLAGGILVESAGMERWAFLAGRYTLLVAGAAFAVALFLGGGSGPLLPSWAWMLVKTLGLAIVFVTLRRVLPVVRPQKLLSAGWIAVLPLIVVQDLFVSIIAVGRS